MPSGNYTLSINYVLAAGVAHRFEEIVRALCDLGFGFPKCVKVFAFVQCSVAPVLVDAFRDHSWLYRIVCMTNAQISGCGCGGILVRV